MINHNGKQKNQRFFGNNFLRKNRKGEITTKQIVTLIILILSFSVILFLIFRLDLGQITNEEICRNSVILKGKSTLGSGNLDCRTSYVCISGGGDCEGINPTKTIEISSEEEDEKRNEIMNALAVEMASCWNQFGEGEVRYTGTAVSASVDCSICSVVEFDKSVQGEVSTIAYDEFHEYLSKTEKSSGESYLKYLYGINNPELFEAQEQIEEALAENIFTDRKYSVITGIDNNFIDFGSADDEWLKVYLVPSEEVSQTKCNNFITKA